MKEGKGGQGAAQRSCGTCGKTVRLAGSAHLVACTVKLATMPAAHGATCSHYVARAAVPGRG